MINRFNWVPCRRLENKVESRENVDPDLSWIFSHILTENEVVKAGGFSSRPRSIVTVVLQSSTPATEFFLFYANNGFGVRQDGVPFPLCQGHQNCQKPFLWSLRLHFFQGITRLGATRFLGKRLDDEILCKKSRIMGQKPLYPQKCPNFVTESLCSTDRPTNRAEINSVT